MHIRELKELKKILYFEGEYAIFRAEDEQGMYRGVINRKGEIVWNEKWRHILIRIPGHPNIFKTIKDESRQLVYFDVETKSFVAPPEDNIKKSKAKQMVENASEVSFFEYSPLIMYQSLRYLSDDFIAFSSGRGLWGVQDLDGNIVLPAQYENITAGGEKYHFAVHYQDNEGVIDDAGNWIIPCTYHSIHWRRDYYVAYIKEPRKKQKGGLLDKAGNVLIPFMYDFMDPSPTEDIISVIKRGRCFFINSRNERIRLF